MEITEKEIKFERWEYPSMSRVDQSPQIPELQMQTDQPETSLPDKPAPEESLKLALEEQKAILQEKVSYADALTQELQSFQKKYAEEMLHDGVALIHKITQKLLQKQFQIDDSLLKKQIEDALELVGRNENDCNVIVSSEDYESIKNEMSQLKHLRLKQDGELAQGSFLIQTVDNEIKMDIEKRLTELFEL